MAEVIIVGGGVSGVCAARVLAEEGVGVLLLEQGGLAAMASGWTQGGVRQSGRHPSELPLARSAVRRWQAMADVLGVDVEYRQGGNLRVARDPGEVPVIRAMVETQRRLGLDLELIEDRNDLRALAPWIADGVCAASFCPSDGQANPVKTVHAVAAAARRAGAVIETGTTVRGIAIDAGRVRGVITDSGRVAAAGVIVAAGVHTPALIAPAGLRLPMRLHHVCVLQTAPLAPFMSQVFGTAAADGSGRQEVDGRVRVTSGVQPWSKAHEDWRDDDILPAAGTVASVVERASRVIAGFADLPLSRTWGGLIDQSPDGLPVLDAPAEAPGLVIAAGFSGHGFALGPVTGEILRDLALGRAPEHDLSAFRLSRFDTTTADGAVELLG
jgi:sarcosine oxidase subunit beta